MLQGNPSQRAKERAGLGALVQNAHLASDALRLAHKRACKQSFQEETAERGRIGPRGSLQR